MFPSSPVMYICITAYIVTNPCPNMKTIFYFSSAFAICFILIFSGCKTATDPITLTVKQGITGTVTASDSHSPISGVTVTLSDKASSQTSTNSNGAYRFDNVPVGDYTVSFSNANYGSQNQAVHVDSGSNSVLNVSLTPASAAAIVSFHVRDARTGLPIQGILVKGDINNNDSLVTDAQGNVQFAFTNYSSPAGFTFTAQKYNSAAKSGVSLGIGFPVHDTISMVRYPDYLVCDYRFAGNFLDSSGKGHDATQHGCKFVTDRFGNASGALQYNGTTDFVSVADATDLNFGKTTDFTVCFWLNYSPNPSTSATPYYLYKGTNVSNIFTGYGITFYQYYYEALAGTTYGEVQTTDNSYGYGDGRWHFITCVYTRLSGISIYVDGKLNMKGSDPNSYLAGNISTTAPLLIGGTGTAKNAYKGMIDDVKIFSVALDESAINQVYHENGW